jgi:hypothetical protein
MILRASTRFALPADGSYLFRLGVALYGFASVSSFMTEIICFIDKSKKRASMLSDDHGDNILNKFKDMASSIRQTYPEIYEKMSNAAKLFEILNSGRTDFIHAYPITNSKKEQILHRRKDSKNKYFEVDNRFLDDFIAKLNGISNELYSIREKWMDQTIRLL